MRKVQTEVTRENSGQGVWDRSLLREVKVSVTAEIDSASVTTDMDKAPVTRSDTGQATTSPASQFTVRHCWQTVMTIGDFNLGFQAGRAAVRIYVTITLNGRWGDYVGARRRRGRKTARCCCMLLSLLTLFLQWTYVGLRHMLDVSIERRRNQKVARPMSFLPEDGMLSDAIVINLTSRPLDGPGT